MRRRFAAALALCIALTAPARLEAKETAPRIAVSIDRRDITVGDRIRVTIAVSAGPRDQVRFPALADNILGVFEIKARGTAVKRGWFGRVGYVGWYDMTSYRTGKQTIQALNIAYRIPGAAEWRSVSTKPIEIQVRSVLPAGTAPLDIRDIKAPLGFFEINWPLLGGGILAVIALTGIGTYLRWRARRVPVKLPHETALEELEAIRAFLAQNGEIKEFFVRISDCIRSYIERAFSVKAPEMTTEEFLNSVKVSSRLTIEQKDLLKDFLHACDLVKFAKYSPTAPEIDRVFAAARTFVDETRTDIAAVRGEAPA